MFQATGVFVDQACRKAKEDQDTNTANHISELFFTDEDPDTDITWEKFQEKLTSAEMQDYLRVLYGGPLLSFRGFPNKQRQKKYTIPNLMGEQKPLTINPRRLKMEKFVS